MIALKEWYDKEQQEEPDELLDYLGIMSLLTGSYLPSVFLLPEDLLDDIDITDKIEEQFPTIERFCKATNTELLEIKVTGENGAPEPAYVFNDGLGHYTIEGVKNTLIELQNGPK